MSTELSFNITPRNFYIKLKDWREINITKQQKEAILWFIWDKAPFIEIPDIDTWEILYAWKTYNIEEILERKFTNTWFIAICDLWKRHNIVNWKYDCNCLELMWINTFDIIPALKMMWFNIEYSADITDEMRKKLYVESRKSDFKQRVDEYFNKIKKEHIKNKRKDDPLYAIFNK